MDKFKFNNNLKIQEAAKNGDLDMVKQILDSDLLEKGWIDLIYIKNARKWAEVQGNHTIENLLSEKIKEFEAR